MKLFVIFIYICRKSFDVRLSELNYYYIHCKNTPFHLKTSLHPVYDNGVGRKIRIFISIFICCTLLRYNKIYTQTFYVYHSHIAFYAWNIFFCKKSNNILATHLWYVYCIVCAYMKRTI